MTRDETITYVKKTSGQKEKPPVPSLLHAHMFKRDGYVHRTELEDSAIIGRGDKIELRLMDDEVSWQHARVFKDGDGYSIEDLGSKNGTVVNGRLIDKPCRLSDKAVIRICNSVLVFREDIRFLGSESSYEYGMAGKFHLSGLITELRMSVSSDRSILLAGPTGTGKELAAAALAQMNKRKLTVINAAQSSSEGELVVSLFGVEKGIFTSVNKRLGQIALADGGALFIDEAHELPRHVQKSLLRIIEDKKLAPIGKAAGKEVDVLFIFASNTGGETHGLAEDLVARLMVINLLPLSERVEDIPAIFKSILEQIAEKKKKCDADAILRQLTGERYEHLMLHAFPKDNVRGLIDIADRITSHISMRMLPEDAVSKVFMEQLGKSTYSEVVEPPAPIASPMRVTNVDNTYHSVDEVRKLRVQDAYQTCGGNMLAMERHLREHGFDMSRRTITKLSDELGLERIKKPRK